MSLGNFRTTFPLVKGLPREELDRRSPSQFGERSLVLVAELRSGVVVDDGKDSTGEYQGSLSFPWRGGRVRAYAGKSSSGAEGSLGSIMQAPA